MQQKNAYGGERKPSENLYRNAKRPNQLVRILEEILYPEVDGDILIRQRVFVGVCSCVSPLFLPFIMNVLRGSGYKKDDEEGKNSIAYQ